MERSLASALAIGVVAAGAAIAGYRMTGHRPQYAQVLEVSPLTKLVRTPREVCKTEQVRHQRPALEPGDAPVGRSGQRARSDETYTTIEQHCATIYETRAVPRGYEVRYRLNGVDGWIHTDRRPGARILIQDGELALAESSGS